MKNPKNVKSKAVFPHEIIHKFMNDQIMSITEKMLLESAFDNIVSTTRETIDKLKQEKPPIYW